MYALFCCVIFVLMSYHIWLELLFLLQHRSFLPIICFYLFILPNRLTSVLLSPRWLGQRKHCQIVDNVELVHKCPPSKLLCSNLEYLDWRKCDVIIVNSRYLHNDKTVNDLSWKLVMIVKSILHSFTSAADFTPEIRRYSSTSIVENWNRPVF